MCETGAKYLKKEPYVDRFIGKYGIFLVYGITLISYFISVKNAWHCCMLIPIAIFIIYDVWFRWIRNRKGNWVESGRDSEETVKSIGSASNYVSFFIAFIAVGMSLLFEENMDEIKKLFEEPLISFYGFLVLALSGVVLLFIPITYNNGKSKEPSSALKNCFFSVLLMEKIIILLLVYLIMQIALRSF